MPRVDIPARAQGSPLAGWIHQRLRRDAFHSHGAEVSHVALDNLPAQPAAGVFASCTLYVTLRTIDDRRVQPDPIMADINRSLLRLDWHVSLRTIRAQADAHGQTLLLRFDLIHDAAYEGSGVRAVPVREWTERHPEPDDEVDARSFRFTMHDELERQRRFLRYRNEEAAVGDEAALRVLHVRRAARLAAEGTNNAADEYVDRYGFDLTDFDDRFQTLRVPVFVTGSGDRQRVDVRPERVRDLVETMIEARREVCRRQTERLLRMPRGCGNRIMGGVYWAALPDLAPTRDEAPQMEVERFIFDPPVRVNLREMGLASIGVKMIENDGVTHLIDVIGARYYPNVCDFIEEARVMGVSRRLPISLPWERLSPESRLIVVHPHGWIHPEDLREYWQAVNCPRPDSDHDFDECAGCWWYDVIGGTRIEDSDMVIRQMPWGQYRAWPTRHRDARRAPAIIASFPLSELTVITDPYDASHDRAIDRIGDARVRSQVVLRSV